MKRLAKTTATNAYSRTSISNPRNQHDGCLKHIPTLREGHSHMKGVPFSNVLPEIVDGCPQSTIQRFSYSICGRRGYVERNAVELYTYHRNDGRRPEPKESFR